MTCNLRSCRSVTKWCSRTLLAKFKAQLCVGTHKVEKQCGVTGLFWLMSTQWFVTVCCCLSSHWPESSLCSWQFSTRGHAELESASSQHINFYSAGHSRPTHPGWTHTGLVTLPRRTHSGILVETVWGRFWGKWWLSYFRDCELKSPWGYLRERAGIN